MRSVSVIRLYPSTCAHFHLLEFLRNSALALSAVRCFVSAHAVHMVSFHSVVHLSAFSLRGVIRYGCNAQGEMRDFRLCSLTAKQFLFFFRAGGDLWRVSLCQHPPDPHRCTRPQRRYVARRGQMLFARLYFSAAYVLHLYRREAYHTVLLNIQFVHTDN